MENLLNKTELLEKVFGDKALLNQIIDMFLDMCPEMVASIENCIKSGDPEALIRTAHAFKGSVGNFSREGAFAQAVELERLGKSANLEQASQVLDIMKKQVQALVHALEEIRSEINYEASFADQGK